MDFFSKLPEDCIAKVLSFTSPQDAYRVSVLGSIFKSAIDSDAVWEAFMPSDYKVIIANSALVPTTGSTKELFLHLAHTPLIIDQGTKSFSLEKRSGRKCYMLAARDLTIVWRDDPRYWRFGSHPESRFPEVAELLFVCWLEISGKISTNVLSPNTLYGAYLVFRLTPQAIGINAQPMEVSCGISGGGEYKTHIVFLDHKTRRKSRSRNRTNWDLPKLREDRWLEIKIGECFNEKHDSEEEEENGDFEMSFKEIKGGHWKSGIIVEGIEIRPVLNRAKN